MTLVEKIQKKADIIARRYRDDIDFISVFAESDKEERDYGAITVEINEWGGPKMKNGKIIGDHDSIFAEYDLDHFLKTFGAKLHFLYDTDDIEHHKIYGYRVAFQ